MATRNDIVIDWHLSPRIINIAAPSAEIVIQDLHDTLRDIEDEPSNLIYPSIITTAGKEDLGGGVTVGLTATLLNAQLAFEARTTEYNTGTATGGSNIILEDVGTGTDFISDGVLRGDIIENVADGSQASVVSVSTTSLALTALTGGTSNIFSPGDDYTLWHVIQCDVDGGNLVAVDSNGSEINSIFTTAFTQVVRTSSSSATLQELASIQFSSFDGKVSIDAVNGVDALVFPAGTAQAPVKTLTFAKIIAISRGFRRLFVSSSTLTIASGDNIDNFIIEGFTANTTAIVLEVGSSTNDTEFFDCIVSGDASGATFFTRCSIDNLIDFEGTMINCQLDNNLTLLAGSGVATIIDSWSGVSGLATPVLDMGGTGNQVVIRRWAGGLELVNYSDSLDSSLDIVSGHIKLASTITAGVFVVRGMAQLTDESTGTAVCNCANLVNPFIIADQVFNEAAADHTDAGTVGEQLNQTAANTSLIPATL